MGPSLAAKLANVWLKSFEASQQKTGLSEYIFKSDQKGSAKTATGERFSEEGE